MAHRRALKCAAQNLKDASYSPTDSGPTHRSLMNYSFLNFSPDYVRFSGPGSSLGIATGYGLDGPGSNPGGGEIFRTCSDRPWGPPSLLYNGYRVFPWGKERPGRDADPSPSSSAEVMKGRAIPLPPPLWAVRPVQSLSACTRVTFTFTLPMQDSESCGA